jgi:hypothetical protein
VRLSYPARAPFKFDSEGRMFIAIPPSDAERFARYYPSAPGAMPPVKPNDPGGRRVLAYLDIKMILCSAEEPAGQHYAPVSTLVTGMRLYTVSARDGTAVEQFFAWAADKGQ